ncbi:MAG: hypothetical protein WC824_10295 [Bacteroidota bacterium]
MKEGVSSILIEGLFYRDEKSCLCAKSMNGEISIVEDILKSIQDKEIQFAMHHLPDFPLDPKRWGGGCCLWEPSGKCPAGHHENPGFLLSIAGKGILRFSDTGWHLITSEGEDISIPLHQMEGHTGRIVAVSILEFKTTVNPGTLESIGAQAKQLQDTLGQFQELLQRIH